MAVTGEGKVFAAYPYGDIEPRFHTSWIHLLVYDAKNNRRVIDGAHLAYGTTNLPHARNQMVDRFLKMDPGPEWFWFIDTDQTFTPDTLDRLVESADPTERPIVGALVYSFNVDQAQKTRPTIWTWTDDGPQRWSTCPRHRMLGPEHGVHGTGTGCLLIHRSVLETVQKSENPAGGTWGDTAWPWFRYGDWINPDGNPDVFGEDLTFMARVGAAGIPVHVNTDVVVGHIKKVVIDDVYHALDTPFDDLLPETYVVVPVKNRLDLTKQLLHQLETQGGYDRIFVFDNGSNVKTRGWLERQKIATVVDAAGKNIHQMWNAGIQMSMRAWPKTNIAILNNDLDLGDEFLARQARTLRSSDLVAVGPNYDNRTIDGDYQEVKGICAARYDGTGGLPGFAFMVRGEAFMRGVPLFDENYQWWFGDNDWLLKLDRLGLKYGIVSDATVTHLEGGSATAKHHDLGDQIAQDEARFRAQWQGR